jgi:hypothetical protein
MENQRFWVIGGEYRSLDFDQMVAGTEQLVGPLATRGQAEEKWREMSEKHRREATVRFTIAAERLTVAAAAQ